MAKRNDQTLLSNVTDEDFAMIVKESVSFSEVKRKIGYKSTSHHIPPIIKRKIEELNLDTTHFMLNSRKHKRSTRRRYDMKEILVENSEYENNSILKRRLIKDGYMKNVCAVCGLKSWNNGQISLQLHHMNGINTDNRIENLQLLCPNCHSQTDFFSGRLNDERHKRRLRKIKAEK